MMSDVRMMRNGELVFQVAVSDEDLDDRLDKTELFSRKSVSGKLLNCVNLTLVLLGIVSSDKYLSVCTERKETTSNEELFLFIKEALQKCGKPDNGIGFSKTSIPVSEINEIGHYLLPGYATYLRLNYPDRDYYHAILLRKDKCGRLFCIDAQVGEDGLYPEQASGVKRIIKYLSNDGYKTCQYITSARNAIIHSGEVYLCQTDRLPLTSKVEKPPSAASIYMSMSLPLKAKTKRYTPIDLAASPGQRIQVNFMSAILKEDTKNIGRYMAEIKDSHLVPEYEDSRGSSLMLAAVKMKMENVVKHLCELGADPNIENKDGESPLDAALKFPEITKILRECVKKGGKKTRRSKRLTKSTRRRR